MKKNSLSGTIPIELGKLAGLKNLCARPPPPPPRARADGPRRPRRHTSRRPAEVWGPIAPPRPAPPPRARRSLNENSLTGTIPPELSTLTNLEQLYARPPPPPRARAATGPAPPPRHPPPHGGLQAQIAPRSPRRRARPQKPVQEQHHWHDPGRHRQAHRAQGAVRPTHPPRSPLALAPTSCATHPRRSPTPPHSSPAGPSRAHTRPDCAPRRRAPAQGFAGELAHWHDPDRARQARESD